jgi:DNA-binding ferritin-like protein (Dps family)
VVKWWVVSVILVDVILVDDVIDLVEVVVDVYRLLKKLGGVDVETYCATA